MQSSRIVAWGLPLAAAIVMGLRAPQFLTAPRFWAEEGSIYFAHAWSHPWWETLWLAPPGYLTLWANGAAVLATRMVGLSAAPLITTRVAMRVQRPFCRAPMTIRW